MSEINIEFNALVLNYKDVNALKPYERNSKLHDKKQVLQIAESIKKFGFNVPVLIDQDNNIIAGHGRVMASKELGMEKIPTIQISHLTEAQKRAFIITDNKLAANSEWDNKILALELEELVALNLDFDLEITGFETNQIDLIISENKDSENDDFPDINASDQTVTKTGDIWLLGSHRLICGDSREPEIYKLLMGNLKADMVIGDPPYNVKIGVAPPKGKEQLHTPFAMAHGEMSAEEYTEFLKKIFGNLVEYSKDGSIHYLFITWRKMYEMQTAGRSHYKGLKNLCIWNKSNAGIGTFYRNKHGLIFVFKNGTALHTNNFKLGQDGRSRTNVWNCPSAISFFKDPITGESRNDLMKMHPTVLPVSIFVDINLLIRSLLLNRKKLK